MAFKSFAPDAGDSTTPRVYFIPCDGINFEVVAADIRMYLGNDATVQRHTYQEPRTKILIQGYRITASRSLDPYTIQCLKKDSANLDIGRRSRTQKISGGSGYGSSSDTQRRQALTQGAQGSSHIQTQQYSVRPTQEVCCSPWRKFAQVISQPWLCQP